MLRSFHIRQLAPLGMGFAYFCAAVATIASTRFDGGVAFLWVGTAILTARLLTSAPRAWPVTLVACAIGSFAATWAFGMGLAAAGPLALINVGESVIATVIMRRFDARVGTLESLDGFAKFLLAAGVVAPMVTGFGGAAAATLALGLPYWSNWIAWYIGHALGTLTFLPVAVFLLRGDINRWVRSARPGQIVEHAMLLALVAATSFAVFSQEVTPLLFLPMLPIMLSIFRAGRLAAAASTVILAVVGGVFTLAGEGPISIIHGGGGGRIQFLQFYLAATVLTVLPVAADLARRKELFRQLRDSEARYRLVTDNSTDIILNLDLEGRIRFVSPSIRQLGGFEPAALVGRNAVDLIDPRDAGMVANAHLRALEEPDSTIIVEYRALTGSGETRWFETHTRAVADEGGRLTGVVSAVRDVSHRKGIEEQLARAAMTDPLTGIANRRAFYVELQRRIAATRPGQAGGCVALFDLDHFKRVNDGFGHAAGDNVLVRFAQIAKGAVRDCDFVARLGGEEFAVILPSATLDQARLVCDRLRQAVGAMRIDADGAVVRVTVSGGVARYAAMDMCDNVVAGADRAMYRAKAEGRDRLAIAA